MTHRYINRYTRIIYIYYHLFDGYPYVFNMYTVHFETFLIVIRFRQKDIQFKLFNSRGGPLLYLHDRLVAYEELILIHITYNVSTMVPHLSVFTHAFMRCIFMIVVLTIGWQNPSPVDLISICVVQEACLFHPFTIGVNAAPQ